MSENDAHEYGDQLIFSQLLEKHEHIHVPLIQRDYAQGRDDQEEVRNEFLDALHDALTQKDFNKLPLNLDFIYGSVKDTTPSRFQPLDGQQRLTTLFLLHWYLSLLDECHEEFRELCVCNSSSRFGYRVRTSSREFFDELAKFSLEKAQLIQTDCLVTLLQDQPWYYRRWRLDPTVQSALVMLDAIHERFKDGNGLYARLTDKKRPAITFQLLELKNFGLSDDLYIKMNARGKPLTPFETFKARYGKLLKDQLPNETRDLDGNHFSFDEYFAKSIDTRWSDFFWEFRDRNTHTFDHAVMNLVRVVILITRSCEEDIAELRKHTLKDGYHFFHSRGWLDGPFSKTLIDLLDVWSNWSNSFSPILPDDKYFKEEKVLEKILNEPTSLRYEDLLQIAAYIQFLVEYKGNLNQEVFQEWMRVVFNLSVNTEYNRTSDFQRSLSSIKDLEPHMETILKHLADPETDVNSIRFFGLQVEEEKLKAVLLLRDKNWRELIDEAELHGYFQGQIGFLFQFAGVEEATTVTAKKTQGFQAQFKYYLKKANDMFDDSGLRSLTDFRWERALLSLGSYMLDYRGNKSFLINEKSQPYSWKRLLRNSSDESSTQPKVLKNLWDSLNDASDINEQLDDIIANQSGLEAWRTALIDDPLAISYCEKRMIRLDDTPNGSVYLLKKIRIDGAYAELFSYCFYKDVVEPMYEKGGFQVFRPAYSESSTTDMDPSIQLHFEIEDQEKMLSLEHLNGEYRFSISDAGLRDNLVSLLQEIGFTEAENKFQKNYPRDSIEDKISELDEKLARLLS